MIAVKRSLVPRFRLKHPRRVIIITIALLVLAATITYGTFSYFAWQALGERSQAATAALRTAVEEKLSKDSTPPLDAVTAVLNDFERQYGADLCHIPSHYAWQTVVPAISDLRTDCKQQTEKADRVTESLKNLKTFLQDETAAAALLEKAIADTASLTDYAAASAAWGQLATTTDISTDEDFIPVSNKLREVANAIRGAYDSIKTALATEDRTGLDEAITTLQESYSDISTIAPVATEARDTLIKAIVERSNQL